MKEFKALKIICSIMVIIICFIAGSLYYISNVLPVNETEITEYINNPDSNPRLKLAILRSVLLNTGQWSEWGNTDKVKIDIILSRINGKQKDAVIIARGGTGKNVIALYKKHNGKYMYTATVDTFTDLRDVQIMPLREQGGSLIVVREHCGGDSLEDIVNICAYAWDEVKFQKVLSIPENYEAYYNELWDENKPASRSNWLKVSERCDILWENSDAPVVHVLLHQNYSLSSSVNNKECPDKTEFEIVRNRDMIEEYVWSGKWMHFILFEGIDRQNGEPVAVIDDLSRSPYGLIGQFSNVSEKYRVKYIDGTIEIVDKDRIKPGLEVKKTRQI